MPSSICAANVNQHVSIIHCSPSVDPEYLAFYIAQPDFQKLITDCEAGATRQALTKQLISAFRIAAPAASEQKRIAEMLKEQLAAVEQARLAAEARIGAARRLPAAYLREVFSTKDTTTWQVRPLGTLCRIVARQVDPTLREYRDLPHVNGENIESGTSRLLWLNSAAEDRMTSGKYLFEKGNILYSKLRPYLRKVTLAPCRGVCSADMYPIETDPTALDSEFAAWMLLSDEFTRYADEESRRARMPKLNREQLFAWAAPLPALETQKALASRLREQIEAAARAEIAIRQELRAIANLRGALLKTAFLGLL